MHHVFRRTGISAWRRGHRRHNRFRNRFNRMKTKQERMEYVCLYDIFTDCGFGSDHSNRFVVCKRGSCRNLRDQGSPGFFTGGLFQFPIAIGFARLSQNRAVSGLLLASRNQGRCCNGSKCHFCNENWNGKLRHVRFIRQQCRHGPDQASNCRKRAGS